VSGLGDWIDRLWNGPVATAKGGAIGAAADAIPRAGTDQEQLKSSVLETLSD
jgi:hypothetical protein